jgi:2-polyprenyl-6-methoxyphenol hydroxylase-like FAD-dependent oxidoreductase
VGANTALRDAELLGRLIGERGGWKDDITGEYEKQMREYASENVKDSYGFAAKQFGIQHLDTVVNV